MPRSHGAVLSLVLILTACNGGPEFPGESTPVGQPVAAPWAMDCRYPDGNAVPMPGRGPIPEAENWTSQMIALWSGLARADRAVLLATLQQDADAVMVTSPCSPNDVFWTHLALRNFTRPTTSGVPREMPGSERVRSFTITPQRKTDLERLLSALVAAEAT